MITPRACVSHFLVYFLFHSVDGLLYIYIMIYQTADDPTTLAPAIYFEVSARSRRKDRLADQIAEASRKTHRDQERKRRAYVYATFSNSGDRTTRRRTSRVTRDRGDGGYVSGRNGARRAICLRAAGATSTIASRRLARAGPKNGDDAQRKARRRARLGRREARN